MLMQYEDYSIDKILQDAYIKQIEKWQSEGLNDAIIIEKIGSMNHVDIHLQMLQRVSKDYYDFYVDETESIIQKERHEQTHFLGLLSEEWGDCLNASRVMYDIAVLSAEEYYHKYISLNANSDIVKERQYVLLVLQHMHARACQEYLEILHLNRLGFADCAYARWRSMFELCCYASFIKQHGEKIALNYFKQADTDDHTLSWARDAFEKNGKKPKRVTFREIYDSLDIDPGWDKAYKLACLVTHASPQGTFKRLSNVEGMNCIPIGQADTGIATPAIQSAISLSWITYTVFSTVYSTEYYTRIALLNQWQIRIKEMYSEAEEKQKKRIEELRKTRQNQE